MLPPIYEDVEVRLLIKLFCENLCSIFINLGIYFLTSTTSFIYKRSIAGSFTLPIRNGVFIRPKPEDYIVRKL